MSQPPSAPPPPPAPPQGEVSPVPAGERVDTLDVLRGFALLGILLVNVELFRGADLYRLLAGEALDTSPADDVAQFLGGWLVSGKFLSSFALLFGVGAAIIGGRVLSRGRSPRGLLARRYGWLLVFGLAHMFLLFSGDILFLYGLAGLLLLPFVFLPPRTLLWWAAGIVAVYVALMLGFGAMGMAAGAAGVEADGGTTGFEAQFEEFFGERRDAAIDAYTAGGLGDQLRARAWEVALFQTSQLLLVPWVTALFLVGFAVGKAGVVGDLAGNRGLLRRTATVGIGVGLVLNLPLGFAGTVGAAAGPDAQVDGWLLLAAPVAQMAGAPLLAAGYLSALALLCQRAGVLRLLRPLRDTGRMALTGYVLQSVLATGFFVWLGYYERLSSAEALAVVAGIWAVVLTTCVLWQRRSARGPLEWLWRRLTYGSGGLAAETGAAGQGERSR